MNGDPITMETTLPVGTVLRPFKKAITMYRRDRDIDDYPLFRVIKCTYGTQGYIYRLECLCKSKDEYEKKYYNRWVPWHRAFNHMELLPLFKLATKAEQVLYQ